MSKSGSDRLGLMEMILWQQIISGRDKPNISSGGFTEEISHRWRLSWKLISCYAAQVRVQPHRIIQSQIWLQIPRFCMAYLGTSNKGNWYSQSSSIQEVLLRRNMLKNRLVSLIHPGNRLPLVLSPSPFQDLHDGAVSCLPNTVTACSFTWFVDSMYIACTLGFKRHSSLAI